MKKTVRIKAVYQSGRVEEYTTQTKADGTLLLKDQKKVDAYKTFPSVTKFSITDVAKEMIR